MVAVEGDFGIGEVVNDHQIVLARELDHALEEREVHHLGRRIGGEREQQQLGLRPGATHRLLEVGDEVAIRCQRHGPQVAARDDHGILMDRVGRVGTQDDVSRPDRHQDEVGQPLLRTDRGDRLLVRVERDPVPPLVPLGDPGPQVRQAPGRRVAVVARVVRRLADLLDDMARRRKIRIPHAEIDDVLAGPSRRRHQRDHLGEHVGRQPIELVEVVPDDRSGNGNHGGVDPLRPGRRKSLGTAR